MSTIIRDYPVEVTVGSDLIDKELFDRIIFNMQKEFTLDDELAVKSLDQALSFVDMCGRYKIAASPSPQVDKGWHSFLLHTKEYFEFCQEQYGYLVGHRPYGPDMEGTKEEVSQTKELLKHYGYRVYEELWVIEGEYNDPCAAGDCGGGCGFVPVNIVSADLLKQ